ncbi:MAG TPA: ComEC/Rec2 family competence protein, partial [Leptospiraceae bacterium]|nr:ComEC/Rec2 family competence protein [Leptospiraceae bacterium]
TISVFIFRIEKKFIISGLFLFVLYSEWTVRQNAERKHIVFSAKDWKTADRHWKSVNIRFEKEIKKNFWEVKISHQNFEFPSILRHKTKSELIYDLECPLSAVKVNEADIKNEYLQFTKKYGSIYLSVRQKSCRRLEGRTDERRLVRKRTEELLEKGKIYDTARDISLGLIFGDSGYLNDDLKKKAREGGILHLFAASGLHIGVLAAFLYFICRRIPFLDYYTEKMIPLALCFAYLYLLNFPVSLLRAYLFASFFLVSQIFFRRMHKMDLILNSALFIRLYDPDSYLSLSFLLSFSAVAGILLVKEDLDILLFGKHKSFFSENLTLSLSASLGTFPVLLYYFNSFSFGSIFLNLILVPLTSLILPVLYAALILQYFSAPVITEILWVNLEILLRTLALLAVEMGESLGFYREFGEGRQTVLNYYYIVILFIIFMFIINAYLSKDKASELKQRIIRISVSFLCFTALILFCYFGYNTEDPRKYP